MTAPRVLIVLGTDLAWSRGILSGFMAVAHERDWTVLHYYPDANLRWVAGEWTPDAAVFSPDLDLNTIQQCAPAALISLTHDRSANGIASVCLDEEAIAALAAEHLLARGFRSVSTFRYNDAPFAVLREQAFIEHVRAAGAKVIPGWGHADCTYTRWGEDPKAMVAWVRSLPKPCGVFTCTDSWGHTVTRYAREAGLRIPEDIALVGVDNDVLACELVSPPLSSVMIPWMEVGRNAAMLVRLALGHQPIAGKRVQISPIDVVARRSSDVLAVGDELVAAAVAWIRQHAEQRLTVTMVAHAVGCGRQKLERRFRRALDRTIQREIQRAHVEKAKHWLRTTDFNVDEVAKRSGFTSASLLNRALKLELGITPGAYRRQVRQQLDMTS